MSSTPWVNHPTDGIETLDVPMYSESEREGQCMVYSLAMALDYLSKSYPDEWVRENIDFLPPSEIRKEITISDQSGWIPKQKELDSISEIAGSVQFTHILRDQSPTEEIFAQIIENHLEKDIPVIPIINAKLLRKDEKAGVHAVVAIGMDDSKIAFQDPWGYPKDIQPKDEFISAWDDVLNQVVTISVGGQQTLERDSALGGTSI